MWDRQSSVVATMPCSAVLAEQQGCIASSLISVSPLHQEFNITGMNKSRHNVVLRDANFSRLIGQQVSRLATPSQVE